MSSVLCEVSKEIDKIDAQLHAFYLKYGINSIKDLEHAIEKGTVVESDVFEDLTRIDYLESHLIFVRKFLHNNEIDLTI